MMQAVPPANATRANTKETLAARGETLETPQCGFGVFCSFGSRGAIGVLLPNDQADRAAVSDVDFRFRAQPPLRLSDWLVGGFTDCDNLLQLLASQLVTESVLIRYGEFRDSESRKAYLVCQVASCCETDPSDSRDDDGRDYCVKIAATVQLDSLYEQALKLPQNGRRRGDL
ncbi:MAG: hypothetical protein RIC55_17205 [Pirellulaceae bacterium]